MHSTLRSISASAAVMVLLSACVQTNDVATDTLTVTGRVTVRGNEPFTNYVLETDDRNHYVLTFPEENYPETPSVLTVTGRLYEGTWDGRPFAHIEVQEIEGSGATLR